MANIYYTDGGYTWPTWSTSFESGFTTNRTGTALNGVTKSSGFTTSVAVGDIVVIYFNNTNTFPSSGGLRYMLRVTAVTSTKISVSGPITGLFSTYIYAWVTLPTVDINDTSNYYSTLATLVPCPCGSYYVGGTPYPFALNPATDTLIFPSVAFGSADLGLFYYLGVSNYADNKKCLIQVTNSGTFTTPITNGGGTGTTQTYTYNNTPPWQFGLTNGTYTNSVTLGTVNAVGGTYTGAITVNNGGVVFGGSFSNTVTLNYYNANLTTSTVTSVIVANAPRIAGGTFTGTVTRSVSYANGFNYITGGTYSPTATCAISNGQLVTTNLPTDPGFKIGGGTFSPIINLSGSRNSVLGAGFP
jgi:hypothetical protein